MASVTSLDADMRNLRMSRYTPQAANEIRAWIESTLGESLPQGDLLDILKDGVALCKLANRAIQPQAGAIKFKTSQMPFIQMENISHFLRACELPPLNLPAHDRFLTVDLFEQKDPAQVLQCLGAFSRQANRINPAKFPTSIGAKKAGSTMSPSATGYGATNGSSWRPPASIAPSAAVPSSAARALSPNLTGGSNTSQTSTTKSSSGPVSSWSSKSDQNNSAPAWNIHQYGYMGGASQGNQGISFGARRQITSQAPSVPSLAEKEKLRRQKEEWEAARVRQQELLEYERKERMEEDEAKARVEEERRWEEETKQIRAEERKKVEQQKREWEEQERRWKDEEETRRKEEASLQAGIVKKPPEKPRVPSSGILRGQSLSDYQREVAALSSKDGRADPVETPEQRRVRELEKQLEEARERERQYQAEREERLRKDGERSRPSTAQTETRPLSVQDSDTSWAGDEREFLRQQWQHNNHEEAPLASQQENAKRPLPSAPSFPDRPLPEPTVTDIDAEQDLPSLPSRPQPMQESASSSSLGPPPTGSALSSSPLGTPNRPLPTPDKEYKAYIPDEGKANRTDQYLAQHTAPVQSGPRISSSQEAGDTSLEQSRLRDSRIASQQKTKAGGWASKSLLEREMERERERQKEWEANQQGVKTAPRDATQGTGEGQSWDVNQYGYIGGDSMNKGSSVGSGINIGGRRQIIGPRPKP